MTTKLKDFVHAEHWYSQFTIHQLVNKRSKFLEDMQDKRKELSDLNYEMIENNIAFINKVISIKRKGLK
jgi:hypothetical protein